MTTVVASGLVTAVDSGMATITASAGEAAGEAVVRVVPPGAPLGLLLDSLMVAFTAEHGIGAAAMGVVKDGVHCGRLIRDIIDDILDNIRIAWPQGRRAPDTANRVLDAAIGESR